MASQRVDLSAHRAAIVEDELFLRFGGQLRNWNGNDLPDLWVRFLDAEDEVILETDPVGTSASDWTVVVDLQPVPAGAATAELVLRGRRNAGTDNDSYFDDLFMALSRSETLCAPPPDAPDGGVDDMGVPEDMGAPEDMGLPDASMADAADVVPDGQVAVDSAVDSALADAGIDADGAPSQGPGDEAGGGCDGCSTPGGSSGSFWFFGLVLLGLVTRRR
jgi:MYXO-CTERM domain-containing protein